MALRSTTPETPHARKHLQRSSFQRLGARKWAEVTGAGERIRTVDLPITSVFPGDLADSTESFEPQNPRNVEIPETARNHQDP